MSSNDATSQAQAGAPSLGSSSAQQTSANAPEIHGSASGVSGDGLKCEWQGCGEQLPSPEQLYEHVCERHVGRKSTNNLNLTCAWGNCRTTTVKRDHITSHIRVHVPLKPHKCDFCQKAFKRPQDLKKHVKTHAEDPNFHASPEPNRGGHNGPGVYGSQPKPGYYPDNPHIGGNPPVYPQYQNGSASNPSAYHGPSYQSNYMTTLYPIPNSMNHEYEVRKKATFDALNEFFGDIKRGSIDSGVYHAVGQRILNLSNMQSYAGGTEYGGGTAVATASHPPALVNHYSLPLSNIRNKADLQHVDQFLEQLQANVYEHETPSQAAAAGVAQSADYVHSTVNYPTNNSPPHLPRSSHAAQTVSHVLPPLTSTAAETPALTPASSALSTYSPSSVHSATISPVSRATAGSLYPTLPAVTLPEIASSYVSSNSAMPSGPDTSFDNGRNRRYPAGHLQRARGDNERASSTASVMSDESLPQIDKLGVRSPSLSNVDPALCGSDDNSRTAVPSPTIDPSLSDFGTKGESNTRDPDWLLKVRVIESIRNYLKIRMDNHYYEDSDDEKSSASSPVLKQETETEKEARSLYPVLQAVHGHA